MTYEIYRNSEIIVFASNETVNIKTGPGTQIWTLDINYHPVESRKNGNDKLAQCRGCNLASNNGCYVTPLPLIQLYKSWKNGNIPKIKMGDDAWYKLFYKQYVRFGAYGNPSCIPLRMVESISSMARSITGYFHDWHLMSPAKAKKYGKYFMASCDENNYKKAQSLGLRTYTISEKPVDNSVPCVYYRNGITCNACSLCNGNQSKKPSIYVKAHGFQLEKAMRASRKIEPDPIRST